MSDLLVYQKSYDFLVWAFNKTEGFPKSKRFSIGQRLESRLLDLVTGLNRLQYTKNNEKLVQSISATFDEIKLILKICYDTKLLSHSSFVFTVEKCDEIGAMIGGLLKASELNTNRRSGRASR